MTGAVPVRIVVADDHPMYRFGLTAALAGHDGIEIVGEAADGAELLKVVERTGPDVVLTDLAMPNLGGTEAIREIHARDDRIGVLVLTMHEDDEALIGALRAGARGYLLKGADRTEIARAVLAVASGNAVYGEAVARRINAFFTQAQRAYAAQVFPELTEREREILELVAQGHSNHHIARRLFLAEKTVRNHVSTVMNKIGTTDRAATVARARDAGLGTS
ncbi:response regulator transcription factor [Streptomyces europaeiscabiei]|uniref:response regulator transcription factor n=1 Tax=Streptomyces europaeiscabiei TaxID=146819 RepID=UPI0029A17DCC|nr:response regulator transcription factor [Streptomyces europaeiscabiei]MDX3611320.1 response regulator transcription factor [Streptomyces europaeiscabiei]WUD30878.1 response regulator transcription factor [Streptomyces europaeiscabiei]